MNGTSAAASSGPSTSRPFVPAPSVALARSRSASSTRAGTAARDAGWKTSAATARTATSAQQARQRWQEQGDGEGGAALHELAADHRPPQSVAVGDGAGERAEQRWQAVADEQQERDGHGAADLVRGVEDERDEAERVPDERDRPRRPEPPERHVRPQQRDAARPLLCVSCHRPGPRYPRPHGYQAGPNRRRRRGGSRRPRRAAACRRHRGVPRRSAPPPAAGLGGRRRGRHGQRRRDDRTRTRAPSCSSTSSASPSRPAVAASGVP